MNVGKFVEGIALCILYIIGGAEILGGLYLVNQFVHWCWVHIAHS
jgi:hypothetical protein